MLTLSAKREEALQQLVGLFARYLEAHPEVALADICYTANIGRMRFSHRLAVVGGTGEEIRERLAAAAGAGREAPGVTSGQVKGATSPKVAWLFTGQGSQYVGMGRQLYDTQQTFRKALERCEELLRPHLEKPLLSVLISRIWGQLTARRDSVHPACLVCTGVRSGRVVALVGGSNQRW